MSLEGGVLNFVIAHFVRKQNWHEIHLHRNKTRRENDIGRDGSSGRRTGA